jgi:hypothetical protein
MLGAEVIGKDTKSYQEVSHSYLVIIAIYVATFPAQVCSALDGSYPFTNGIFCEPGNGANIELIHDLLAVRLNSLHSATS